jgi:hypothetical protein
MNAIPLLVLEKIEGIPTKRSLGGLGNRIPISRGPPIRSQFRASHQLSFVRQTNDRDPTLIDRTSENCCSTDNQPHKTYRIKREGQEADVRVGAANRAREMTDTDSCEDDEGLALGTIFTVSRKSLSNII